MEDTPRSEAEYPLFQEEPMMVFSDKEMFMSEESRCPDAI
jgi:hypothetical protein